jgi:Domain of unknown function (DUF4279)
MSSQECKFDVTMYVRGDALDPNIVTAALGVAPSTSQRKGGNKADREFVAKIGVWALEAEKQSNNLDDLVQELSSKISAAGSALTAIQGVDEAYLDVLVTTLADDDGGGTCEFRLAPETTQALAVIGVPARFTVAVVKR